MVSDEELKRVVKEELETFQDDIIGFLEKRFNSQRIDDQFREKPLVLSLQKFMIDYLKED